MNGRFKTAELFGKLVNLGDDIGKGFIKDSAELKNLATGETLVVERKGKDPFDLRNYAKLILVRMKYQELMIKQTDLTDV